MKEATAKAITEGNNFLKTTAKKLATTIIIKVEIWIISTKELILILPPLIHQLLLVWALLHYDELLEQ